MIPFHTRDLLKQTECVRTVSVKILYRLHKHFTVKHIIQSKMKEAGRPIVCSVQVAKELQVLNRLKHIVEV